MTDYPSGTFTPSTWQDNVDDVAASVVNNPNNEIKAIETDLVGTGISGGLKQAAASFYANWIAQHNADGTHKDITATDITAETISLTSQPSFSAYRASGKSIATGTETTIDFTTERYDIGSDFDSTTGIFTAPSDGIYTFSWGVWSGSAIWNTGQNWYARCFLNDTTVVADSGLQTQVAGTYAISANGSILLQLSTGDTVRIKAYHLRGLATLTGGGGQCYFSGHKIS